MAYVIRLMTGMPASYGHLWAMFTGWPVLAKTRHFTDIFPRFTEGLKGSANLVYSGRLP